ncbi:helix-turn-helix transcriptional regulator [Streptomyces sp. SID13666]|uniref:helix-turn-helix domain-containing protein n=1 Tax=unclassified Streptomyces TaxID=2593676 RepID=UPI0013C09BE2|nr:MULTISPECIES: helix-turn-helix transcriptional regulator [unclassified Streptomyces]NEA56923.1 helix-turn-helix transcriptional regulator [Streptomyces sp. SID13666]NEA77261.1 helix-turn-helix transcriptional regulator [Streptomyces sp. SID13588]
MYAADTTTGTVGANIAALRKTREWTQPALAHRAGVSVSLLQKIEVGDRACLPAVATQLADALGVSVQVVYGQPYAESPVADETMSALRAAVRRYSQPDGETPDTDVLHADLRKASVLRAATQYRELAETLPSLINRATIHAHQADDPEAWALLVDAYSCAYTVAHRLGYPDLAELIVARQQWAATRTWSPIAQAASAWTEAGTFQTAGDYDGGMGVIERAIVLLSAAPSNNQQAIVAAGSLHLRAITLASRARNTAATAEHVRHASTLADQLGEEDMLCHNLTFGKGNTRLHQMASWIELDKPHQAVGMAEDLTRSGTGLPGLAPTRIGHLHIDAARAHLAAGNRDGALESLLEARRVAPQMARIHPMAREVLRVLVSLHRRAKPELTTLARWAGLHQDP